VSPVLILDIFSIVALSLVTCVLYLVSCALYLVSCALYLVSCALYLLIVLRSSDLRFHILPAGIIIYSIAAESQANTGKKKKENGPPFSLFLPDPLFNPGPNLIRWVNLKFIHDSSHIFFKFICCHNFLFYYRQDNFEAS